MKTKYILSMISGICLLAMTSVQAATITLAEQGVAANAATNASVGLNVGSSLTLDIWALNFPLDTFGGAIGFTYDAAMVTIDSWTFNTAVGAWSDGLTGGGVNDGVGTVTNMYIFTPYPNGLGASDVLIGTITFTATALGDSLISLFEVTGGNELITNNAVQIAPLALGANISAVPLPPAIWLLGSALVGLMGLSRRKQQAALKLA